jgi:Na+/H+ antiporter NhaA
LRSLAAIAEVSEIAAVAGLCSDRGGGDKNTAATLTNPGVALRLDMFSGRERLMAAIIAGLVIGQPVGILTASTLAVSAKLAIKPKAYSRAQLAGAGVLAGIGFTMSLFIASRRSGRRPISKRTRSRC